MMRKAFILTELLTGMMLQAMFAITLCGAFYMLLSFSTSTQQILAAHDEAQMVISYIDNRIRNAGAGMSKCSSPQDICKAFSKISAIKNLVMPVAITTSSNPEKSVSEDGIYKGNILTILYAHKDNKQSGLIVLTDDMTTVSIDSTNNNKNKNHFSLLGGSAAYTGSNFGRTSKPSYIMNYAALESSGYPVFLSAKVTGSDKDLVIAAPTTAFNGMEIFPMSELLNIECERMSVDISQGESSFMVSSLGENNSVSKWNTSTPHTKGILEIYMELDTKPPVPIFDLRVLVSEGKSDSATPKPTDWPEEYWDKHTRKAVFQKHKLHVSRASWKLYNLAHLKYH